MLDTPTEVVLVTKTSKTLSESEGGDVIDNADELIAVEGEEREDVGGRPRMQLLSKESCGMRFSLLDLDPSAPARQSSCKGVILLFSERLHLLMAAGCKTGSSEDVRRFAGRDSRDLTR